MPAFESDKAANKRDELAGERNKWTVSRRFLNSDSAIKATFSPSRQLMITTSCSSLYSDGIFRWYRPILLHIHILLTVHICIFPQNRQVFTSYSTFLLKIIADC